MGVLLVLMTLVKVSLSLPMPAPRMSALKHQNRPCFQRIMGFLI